MKKIITSAVILILTAFTFTNAFTQNAATTIILLRHAEKETTGGDPALSPIGLERSYKLPKALSAYHPDQFYSTDYIRTKQTLEPWANATGKQIEIYDADELTAFAEKLKKMQGKTIIVAGHSNTTPQLANLLIGKEKYKQLEDNVYNKIWIITLENDSVTDEVIEY